MVKIISRYGKYIKFKWGKIMENKNKKLEEMKADLIDLQNELIDNVIVENNIDDDYIYDYTEYDSRIGVISEMIDILDDLME